MATDELCVNTIRTLAMDAVQKANSGHPGTPMAMAPVAYTLWQHALRIDPTCPIWPNRDRFVLSCGHASMLLYSLLHLARVKQFDAHDRPTGRDAVTLDDIEHFRQLGSLTPGHPEYHMTTGVEATTGPLGQGVGMSVGMAIAERWMETRYNKPDFPVVDHDIYVICSDGDMEEGISHEAASIAGHLGLSNLCWIYDSNQITIEGNTSLAFSEDVAARFLAYGWNVRRLRDANDMAGLRVALAGFKAERSRPTIIVVESHIGFGAPHKQDTAAAHGEPLGEDEIRAAKRSYGWPEDAHFLVPDGVYDNFAAGVGARGAAARTAWQELFDRYRLAYPALADEFDRMQKRELPQGWEAALPEFPADPKGLATRDSGGKVLNALAAKIPYLLGGAADLAPSTKTNLTAEGSFEAGNYAGRNFHFGIREHAMGAICNGMALSHLRPFGSGFLIFSDYMREPIRLSAVMELPVTYVFTHDSIGVGEDGPTHQPIEQLASLRAIPGLLVLRPADANEAAQCWRVALSQTHRPSCLALSRQPLPTLDRTVFASAEGVLRGAYVLAEAEGGRPDVILIGTGSEVSLCVRTRELLAKEGIKARVVSMPSWELFEAQDEAYRDEVLPPDITARVAVEQAATMGWERYVFRRDAVIGMRRFGASAPLSALLELFGFTPEKVAECVRAQLARAKPKAIAQQGGHGAARTSEGAAAMNPLKQLEECGQSPWLDYVRRSLIEKGEIATLISRDGLKGMTSNPSIFEKGIGETEEYNAVFESFVKDADRGVGEIYEHLAVHDIEDAADALRPVFDATKGRDGYISLEVSPYLARDAEASIHEAHRLAKAVSRPNLMVKVPATPECIPAIRRLLADGLSINVTLLFAVEAYEKVANAYVEALEERAKAGKDVANIASVASFFVSRIDSLVDKKIDAKLKGGGDKAKLDALRGKVAIANAKRAYALYKKIFSGPRWEALAAKGAHTQRLLWASTSTKNPAYRDVLYVEELIGRDTVNTLPPATMDAFRDHGVIKKDAIEQDVAGAEALLADLQKAGISLQEVTGELVDDGVAQFADAFDSLLGAVARRRRERLEPHGAHQRISVGALEDKIEAEAELWRKHGNIRRLWAGDASLWTGGDEAKWLGWLRSPDAERADLAAVTRFAEAQKAAGIKHVVLLGMGGSSLGPQVLADTLPAAKGWPRFHVLDSTDPAQIHTLDQAIDINHALFVVSSKSGSTTEPNIFRDHFLTRAREVLGDKAGACFVAVTDPGSSMEKAAKDDGFAATFYGDKTIGGRYSVLSKFGMVPGAAIGLDMDALLASAQGMARACAPEAPPAQNPGVQLGLLLGVAAREAGRDKVTILAGPGIESLGAWLEQLLAESTGKHGKGLIPIGDEPLVAVDDYGSDRVFAYLHLDGRHDPQKAHLVDALEHAGHPVVRIMLPAESDIGAEFFRWEIATAVAGAVIGIDPFDQPDVEASKVKTRALTDAYEKSGSLPGESPIFREDGVALFTDDGNARSLGRHNTLEAYLRAHLGRAGKGDYVALLAYLERNNAHTEALQAIRRHILEKTHCATALGFGPRFLHSTGQAYKGGPASGVFLQITTDDAHDMPVPGHTYSFGVVKAAQARGDFDVLIERGRRALRVHLTSVEHGLATLAEAVDRALN